MKVKLTKQRVGVNTNWAAGDIVDLADAEACRLIIADQAKPIGKDAESMALDVKASGHLPPVSNKKIRVQRLEARY